MADDPVPSTSVLPEPGPHISHVFLAEFDINQGSILKHQYPSETGADSHLLAEHMLPDGAHDRNEDWTVFYLNQIPQMSVGHVDKGKAKEEPPQLLYVMSLVRTKKVATVKRGALVKALAVASPHPYIQIYKPLLLLALDTYLNDPSLDTLAALYTSINSMDLSSLPSLTRDEKLLLRSSERSDIFDEKFPDFDSFSASNRPLPTATGSTEVLDVGSEAVDHRSVSSGSLSSLASKEDLSGSLEDGGPVTSRSRAGTGNSEASSVLQSNGGYGAGGGAPMPAVPMTARPKDTHFFDTKVAYGSMTLPVRIPLSTFPEEVGEYSLIKLIQTFTSITPGPIHPHLHSSGVHTPPIILLFNALVTHKRVVFLGHGLPAGDVANLVLAACALGSGCGAVLGGFVERAFPYTNLTNLDNLETVPGFIAGVCNPAFANRPSWWDVLCNIETGKITVSKDLQSTSGPPAPLRSNSGDPGSNPSSDDVATAKDNAKDGSDVVFMEEIMNAINAHYGESVIRARFTEYAMKFVRVASRQEEDVIGGTTIGWPSKAWSPAGGLGSGLVQGEDGPREMGIGRLEAWRKAPSYKLYQAAFKTYLEDGSLRHFDLHHQLSRLRQGKKLPPGEVDAIIKTVAGVVRSDEQIIAVLTHLPPYFGGLLPVSFGLFHPNESIRYATADFLDGLSYHPTGKKFVQSLNAFHRSAYVRLSMERPSKSPRVTKSMS